MSKTLLVIGECMLELAGDPASGSLRSGFAGDTLNAAIYAHRFQPAIDVVFATGIGTDPVSKAMLGYWEQQGINCSAVLTCDDRIPGSYMIVTDADGERSFHYWRRDSAATRWPELLREAGGSAALPKADMVFLSGISLGILCDSDRSWLLGLLAELRASGCHVAFDPNYRPALWGSVEEAADWTRRAYQASDLALAGLDEHEGLFGHNTPEEVAEFCLQLGVKEVVAKCGTDGVYCHAAGETSHLPFNPASRQVDSTAAGDSFAGTYVAARLSGIGVPRACADAAAVARLVVQHPGAIIPEAVYLELETTGSA